jgi:hypothetical protein
MLILQGGRDYQDRAGRTVQDASRIWLALAGLAKATIRELTIGQVTVIAR